MKHPCLIGLLILVSPPSILAQQAQPQSKEAAAMQKLNEALHRIQPSPPAAHKPATAPKTEAAQQPKPAATVKTKHKGAPTLHKQQPTAPVKPPTPVKPAAPAKPAAPTKQPSTQ